MCGFSGFLRAGICADDASATALAMADAIAHRGPDGAGVWVDPAGGIALSHRRLAIIDLSDAGSQPMASADGRFVVVFNGEIYNHHELRRELEVDGAAPSWRGHSDTETLLAGVVAWGVLGALERSTGMFALALWDRSERKLHLARDRFGEKPLYYGWQGETFLFGSDLRALRRHPDFRAGVDRNALTLLLRHNCVPAPHTIHAGIFKLRPGHVLEIPFHPGAAAKAAVPYAWWSFDCIVEAARMDPFAGTETEAVAHLDHLLRRSVRGQMLADVPLGAFLSGGIDSSTIVALMQAQSSRPIKTFTIGFDEVAYDEAVHAREVARHLGTEHVELYVRPEDALAVVPDLSVIYSEPFADSSQIPTFLVSRLARRSVAVALSGDAGDELFGGYNRYLDGHRIWRRVHRWPALLRRSMAGSLRAVSPSAWDRMFAVGNRVIPSRLAMRTPGDKLHKFADVLAIDDVFSFYRQVTSHYKNPGLVVPGALEPETLVCRLGETVGVPSFEQWMMNVDAQTYLPDDILVKVDRAAMGVSLETRVPFLDRHVAEFAWQLPLSMKIRDGMGKWVVRRVLDRYVPRHLIERPKMGFGIPIDRWLRGPLRDWAEGLLDASRLRHEGYFDPQPIRAMWQEHLSGRRNWQHHLWTVLMFQAWLESLDGERSSADVCHMAGAST